jgi:3-oxoacyl-[acyl-carrier-protein] synthase-3
MNLYAHITGWGTALPEKVLTNDDVAKIVDTNDAWIRERTGIRQRHIASDTETTASLAARAAVNALKVANVLPGDIDLIIVSTSSPEYVFPSTASIVQNKIGAVNAGAFDLSAACTGFIFALNMATQAIRSGAIQTAIVIGAETLSRITNWEDRNTCILFGDGAGAFVLQASPEPGGVITSVMRSDGSGADLLSLPGGGSAIPASHESINQNLHYIQMNGREVFRFATKVMARSTLEVVEKAAWELEEVSLIIPHQANRRIIETAARGLKLPIERFAINLHNFGNTSTASIPLAAHEAVQTEQLQPGDKIVLVGFGAGLTWGALSIIWTGPFPVDKPVNIRRYQLFARIITWFRKLLRRIEGLIWGRKNPPV